MPSETTHVSISAGARQLGVHRETLRQWIDEGKVRAIVLPNGRRRVLVADLDAILQPQQMPVGGAA